MGDRGTYRAIKVVLLDGPDYQELPERARHVFLVLKLSLGPSGIEVHYPAAIEAVLAARTGMPGEAVAGALDLLEERGWIQRERNVIWAVGQLQHEPSLNITTPNHRKSVAKHVAGLPRLPIVGAFCRKYHAWLEDTDGIGDTIMDTIPEPMAITEDRIPNTEYREPTTTSSIDDGAGAPPNERAEPSGPPPETTPDSPTPSTDNHWRGFDPNDDDHWKALRKTLYTPLRTYVWKGTDPPDKVPPGWNISRELSVVRQWLRDGTVEPDEAERLLVKAPQVCGWTGPGSLAWLNTDRAIGQVKEIVGAVRKSGHGSRLDATKALQNITGSAA